jgi:hypothetical protein
VFFHADAFGLEPDVDPFVFEDFRDGFGNVFIVEANGSMGQSRIISGVVEKCDSDPYSFLQSTSSDYTQ